MQDKDIKVLCLQEATKVYSNLFQNEPINPDDRIKAILETALKFENFVFGIK